MFAVSATTATQFASALTARPRNARHCRRAAGVVAVNASSSEGEGEDNAVVFTSEQLNAANNADALKTADAEWAEKAAEKTPAAPAFSAAIDPADGSVAEAAPLGDDLSMLSAAMVAFKEPRAVEIINGRVAMIGWMAALFAEFTHDQSLMRQVLNTRTFTLADGVVKTSTMPAEGMFLIPVTVLLVIAASLAPQLNNADENGLEKEPNDFFFFKAQSEMVNGRGAMIGLTALLFAERFTHGAALF